MIKGKIYFCVDKRFPFDCPYGIYVEDLPNGFIRFVWDGKDLMMNGGTYEERSAYVLDLKDVVKI